MAMPTKVDMALAVYLTDFETSKVKYDLIQIAQERNDLHFSTIRDCFLRNTMTTPLSEEQSKDVHETANHRASVALSDIHCASRALQWMFAKPNSSTAKNPFAVTLEELNDKSKDEKASYVAVFKQAIKKEEELNHVSEKGIMAVKSLHQLMFMSKHFHTNDLIGKVFAKKPCTCIFEWKTAHFIWTKLKREEVSWELLREIVFLCVIAQRTDGGELRYCVHESDEGNRGRKRLACEITCRLYKNDKRPKNFDDLRNNPFQNKTATFAKVHNGIQKWLLHLVSTPEGEVALSQMPIPLCVYEKSGLIYTRMWYDMEKQMVKDLKHYIPNEEKKFPSDVCPVCLEDFELPGTGSNGFNCRTSGFMGCGHAICRTCFYHCEIVEETKGTSKELRKCPICRTETYLRDLTDRDKFVKWCEKNRGEKELTSQQMAPLIAMVERPGAYFIEGGPGTGKSESVGLVTRYERDMCQRHPEGAAMVGRSVFIAPTGTAAKNVGDRLERGHFQVNTVNMWLISLHKRRQQQRHSHFEGDVSNCGLEFPIPFLFVDEAGMLGLWLTALVLREACAIGIKRVMFIGDRFQLPPVGSVGSLLASSCISKNTLIENRVFKLTTCFRSKDKGINNTLSAIRDVMQSIEDVDLGKGGTVKKLTDKCFKGKDGDDSVKLEIIKKHEKLKKGEQRCILERTLNVLRKLKGAKCEGGTQAPLSDTVCVLSAKKQKTCLLDVNHLKSNNGTSACIEPYLEIMELMNPNRASKKLKRTHTDAGKEMIGRFTKGDRIMCLNNISVDEDNSKPKQLVLSNGSQGHVVSVRYASSKGGKQNRDNVVEAMVLDFDGQQIRFPVSEWYRSSDFFVPNSSEEKTQDKETEPNSDKDATKNRKRKRTVADINSYNEKQFSKLFLSSGMEFASVQTIHKYQGSQKDDVVVIVYGAGAKKWNENGPVKADTFHTLNLLYTAASRAKKRIRFVMDSDTLTHFTTGSPALAKHDRHLITLLHGLV